MDVTLVVGQCWDQIGDFYSHQENPCKDGWVISIWKSLFAHTQLCKRLSARITTYSICTEQTPAPHNSDMPATLSMFRSLTQTPSQWVQTYSSRHRQYPYPLCPKEGVLGWKPAEDLPLCSVNKVYFTALITEQGLTSPTTGDSQESLPSLTNGLAVCTRWFLAEMAVATCLHYERSTYHPHKLNHCSGCMYQI